MTEINFLVAFIAGLASFLAPCVIPLVPAFIGYISGVSVSDLTNPDGSSRYNSKVLVNSLFYIAGFSLVFILLGLSATAISKTLALNRSLFLQIGGSLIILFGLYSLGAFNFLRFTLKEFQFQLPESLRTIRFLGPFLLGTTFALAWTPCVGPILGAILTLAATTQNLAESGLLLFVYSLGISLPFLLIALTLGSSYKLLLNFGSKLNIITWIGGFLLIIIGILMVTQNYDKFSGFILGKLYQLEFYRNLQSSF